VEQTSLSIDQRLTAMESVVAVMQEAIAGLTRRLRKLEAEG
jgi:hypothetical protein